MALASGSRLGAYEIVAPLGAGGMGGVYRARDPRLGRDVALKILPDAFTADTERVARFQREAKVLASLNHPNIAIIHGLEHTDRGDALVMELVEGEDLAQRIARGAIPLDEALPIARQIAEALEAAHEQGIIHRDLKPANIKLRPDGSVKVLDFGLAKALEPASARADATASPTITSPAMMTGVGVLLGTAAYMSPEQARGRSVDKGSDIWAFGCVLYEMLTGMRAFGGEDVTDTLASVIRAKPNLESVPANLRRLLRSCLEKDPRKRLRDIGDVWHLMDAGESAPLAARHGRVLPSVAVVASVAVVVLAFQSWNRPSPVPATARLSISLPLGQEISSPPAISADGQMIAYTAQRHADAPDLYVRTLNVFESRVIQESGGAKQPFFSPDGRWVAFFARGQLYKVEVSGGGPVRIADARQPLGGTWQEDDTIIYTAGTSSGLLRVPANGGMPESLTKPDGAALGYAHVWPQALPGGLHVLFTVWGVPRQGYAVLSLDSRRWNVVVAGDWSSLFAPSQRGASGYLLVRAQGAGIRAAALDPSRPVGTASDRAVLDGVYFYQGGEQPFLSVSKTGTAVYAAGDPTRRSLDWVDRSGQLTPLGSDQAFYSDVAIAPDGRRAVVKDRDIWVLDLSRGNRRRLTFEDGGDTFSPVWSRDGTRIVFSSVRGGDWDLYSQPVDTSLPAEVLLERPYDQYANSVAPDGSVIYTEQNPVTGHDLWRLASDGKPTPLRLTPRNEGGAAISPDGRWLAYMSDESGRNEVYVQRYPEAANTITVSKGGGAYPKWSQDNRELFYVGGEAIVVVHMTADGSFGTPRRLFDYSSFVFDFRSPYIRTPYDVSHNGTGF